MTKENAVEYIKDLNAKGHYGFEDLCGIMALLRSKNGYAWDREQTHKSIRKNLIEETYEVIEAIDKDDYTLMREELGDLLLQVVFHSQMAKEEERFDIGDVIDELCKKLIIRHPHVFGDITVSGSAEVLKNWDTIKYNTKKVRTSSEAMNRISPALPALMRAHKIGEKGAKIGFDFDDPYDALAKVKEEVAEVEEAIKYESRERISEEIGDLLLAVVNVARLSKVDSEEALYKANEKFIGRFTEVEKYAAEHGIDITAADRETKEALWERSKH